MNDHERNILKFLSPISLKDFYEKYDKNLKEYNDLRNLYKNYLTDYNVDYDSIDELDDDDRFDELDDKIRLSKDNLEKLIYEFNFNMSESQYFFIHKIKSICLNCHKLYDGSLHYWYIPCWEHDKNDCKQCVWCLTCSIDYIVSINEFSKDQIKSSIDFLQKKV
jgi:hypothetical protein